MRERTMMFGNGICASLLGLAVVAWDPRGGLQPIAGIVAFTSGVSVGALP